MFAAGQAGDLADLRLLLACGILGSSSAAGAMVAAYFLSGHRLWFVLAAQVASGLFQCVWPSSATGSASRGGAWSWGWGPPHLGRQYPRLRRRVGGDRNGLGVVVRLPRALIGLLGVVVLKWLVVSPEQVGLDVLEVEMSWGGDDEEEGEGEEGELLGGETMDLPVEAICPASGLCVLPLLLQIGGLYLPLLVAVLYPVYW